MCLHVHDMMTVELIPCRLTLWPSPLVPSRSRAYHTPSWLSRLRYRHESMRGFTLGAYAGAVEISRQNWSSSPGAWELTTAAIYNKKMHTQFIALLWTRYPAAATWCELGCRVALKKTPDHTYRTNQSCWYYSLYLQCMCCRESFKSFRSTTPTCLAQLRQSCWCCSTSGSWPLVPSALVWCNAADLRRWIFTSVFVVVSMVVVKERRSANHLFRRPIQDRQA